MDAIAVGGTLVALVAQGYASDLAAGDPETLAKWEQLARSAISRAPASATSIGDQHERSASRISMTPELEHMAPAPEGWFGDGATAFSDSSDDADLLEADAVAATAAAAAGTPGYAAFVVTASSNGSSSSSGAAAAMAKGGASMAKGKAAWAERVMAKYGAAAVKAKGGKAAMATMNGKTRHSFQPF